MSFTATHAWPLFHELCVISRTFLGPRQLVAGGCKALPPPKTKAAGHKTLPSPPSKTKAAGYKASPPLKTKAKRTVLVKKIDRAILRRTCEASQEVSAKDGVTAVDVCL